MFEPSAMLSVLSIGVRAIGYAVSAVYRCSSRRALGSVLSRCSSLHVGAVMLSIGVGAVGLWSQCCVGVGAYMLEQSALESAGRLSF